MRSEDENRGPIIRDRRRIDPVTGQVRNPPAGGPQQGWPGQAAGQPRPAAHSAGQSPGAAGAASGNAGGRAPGSQGAGGGSAAGSDTGTAGNGNAGDGTPAGGTPGQGHAGEPDQASKLAGMLAERTADLQRVQADYANYRKRVERDRIAVREQALANVLHELLPVLDDIGRAREHGELTGGFKSVAESLESIVVKLGLTSYGENGDPFDPALHEALMHSYSPSVTEPTCVQILQPGYKVGERIIRPARVAVAEPGGGEAAADGEAPASRVAEMSSDADPSAEAGASGPADASEAVADSGSVPDGGTDATPGSDESGSAGPDHGAG